ncbi:MAG: MucR family transcriptional regulator [Rhizobiaceae bacterium]
MTTEKDINLETELSAEIVAAYVSNNPIAADQLPDLIRSVFESVTGLASENNEPKPEKKEPAVSIRSSVKDDYIICLEDGKKFKTLKRHLRTHYDLSPDQYRQKWGLKADYPMTAPSYTAKRSELAKSIGLGRKTGKRK